MVKKKNEKSTHFFSIRKLSGIRTYLEYRSTVRCAPRIQQIVFACRHEPFTARGETQGQYARLVQVQLVFVRFQGVQNFDV